MSVSASSICVLLLFLIVIPFLQWNLYQWISNSRGSNLTGNDNNYDGEPPSPLFVTGSSGSSSSSSSRERKNNNQPTQSKELEINKLKRIAYANPEGSKPFIESWQQILDIDERNLEAHVMLGWTLITIEQSRETGIRLLEEAFDETKVTPTIDYSFPQTYMIAATIGRYRAQVKEYTQSKKFLQLALTLSERHSSTKQSEVSCILVQLATLLNYFPASEHDADEAIELMNQYSDQVLNGWDNDYWPIQERDILKFPGAAADPFVHCALNSFSLSFYYRADVAFVAKNQYLMKKRGWPKLDYTAEFVKRYDNDANGEQQHSCIDRKIRLAVISGVITEGHSNSESFGGVLSRLDRNVFDVTYLLLVEPRYQQHVIASFTRVHPSDNVYVWAKEERDTANGGAWITRLGKEVEKWEMDIIFYTDLTMSNLAQRMGMMRLAPVQVNSHGHPMTSGHDRSVMQYFISWEAAELPLEQAQTHYTEELKLLPPDIIFQYYERRVMVQGQHELSRMDGQPFSHIHRSDLGLPTNKHVYLCMQKPMKFHPEFDKLLCGIMIKDKEGVMVLHREMSPINQNVFEIRLKSAGCDLSRIMFLEEQPHHRLLALYREATVVLDSYPAGGDTTTREVIEMGKPLVTLPARLLGGRWSMAYLNKIGLKSATKKALIANSFEEYIDLAVTLAHDDNLRKYVEADILECAPNLFQRLEAVVAWQEMLLEISPYKQCKVLQTPNQSSKIQMGEL